MSLSGSVLRFVLPKAVPEPEQLTIAHAGDTLPVTFVRSRRARRASLRVDAARRRIVLTAPLRMPRGTAVGFAEAQAGWIAARLRRLPARRPFVDGAELPLFGEPHCIRHRHGVRGTVWRARVERPVKRITLRDSRSRWGSCGPHATLSFSWRLVFAPPEVLDYLVAHEVAHLVHLNHGPRFWALARAICDGPIEAPQAWLKKNGETLLQYGA